MSFDPKNNRQITLYRIFSIYLFFLSQMREVTYQSQIMNLQQKTSH